jgi:phospholipid transport system substrate-binding protein
MLRALILLAAGITASATDTLKARDAEIRPLLPPVGQKLSPAGRDRLAAVISGSVDLKNMAEASLGSRWAGVPEAKRRKYVKAFEDRFKRASVSELEIYRDTQISYDPEEASGDQVRVATHLKVKGEPTEVTYLLLHGAKGWRIVDIVVDGVSTVENYRASFAKVVAKDGIDGLIDRLNRGAQGDEIPRPAVK